MDARRLDATRDYELLRVPAGSRFRRTVRRFGQDRDRDLDALSEDYYQEAWLAIERKPTGALVERDPAAYIASTMSNLFLTDVRRRRVETLALEDGAMDVIAESGDAPDEKTEIKWELNVAREVVESLPDREKTAFVMRWLYDCGHEEIAETLGVSHRTARLLLEKAGKRLRPALESVEEGSWCDQYQSTISAIERGWPVGPTRRDSLEGHLEHCAHCRAAIGRVRGLAAITPLPLIGLGLAGAAGGGGLLAAIKGALGLSGGGGASASSGTVAAAVATAAVAGVAAVAVVAVGGSDERERSPARPVAAAAATPTPTAAPAALTAQPPAAAQRSKPKPAAKTTRKRKPRARKRTTRVVRASSAPAPVQPAAAAPAPAQPAAAAPSAPAPAPAAAAPAPAAPAAPPATADSDPTEVEFGFEKSAAVAVGNALALAPTYTVHSCRGPAGEPLPTGAFDRAFGGENLTLADHCASGGSLELALESDEQRKQFDFASYTFFAPAGTKIAGYRAWMSTSVEKGDGAAGRIEDPFQPDEAAALCRGKLGCTGEGDPTTPLSDKNLVLQLAPDRDIVKFMVTCEKECPPGRDGPTVALSLHRSQMDLTDAAAPQLTGAPAGALVDATSPRSGVLEATIAASDAGGGLREVVLEVDGKEALRMPFSPGDGDCAEPFTDAVPCPLAATATVAFDTRTLADGQHTLAFAVTDATGVNQARSEPVTITTANPDAAQGPPATTGADQTTTQTSTPTGTAGGALTPAAGLLAFADSRARRVRYDTLIAAPGTLRTATGAPLPFTRIEVTSTPRVAGSGAHARPALVTDGAGNFTLRLRARNSQTLTLSAGAASAQLQVRVPSLVATKANRRRARNGDSLKLDGRLAGEAFQEDAGKLVEIQVRASTGWRTIDTAIARRGRFRWLYRFRATTRPTTYRFRALVRAEDGWPFDPGASAAVAVRVRP